MLNSGLYTRKYIDFVMWFSSIIIIKHGLHKTLEGQLLLAPRGSPNPRVGWCRGGKIFPRGLPPKGGAAGCINSNRYFQKNELVPLDFILEVLSMKPIYDPSKPHEYNYRSPSRLIQPYGWMMPRGGRYRKYSK